MTRSFQRFGAFSAMLAAAAGLVFTVSFAVVVQDGDRWAQWTSWTALLVGGLATLPVMTALYARLGRTEPEFALVGFVLGVAGAIGATVHAAFELSALAKPGGASTGATSGIDPRGVMTFAVTGLALGLFGWLILRTTVLPRSMGRLALSAAFLLLVVYVGRLTVVDPKSNAIRVAALASGLILLPGFYLQVARALLRDAQPDKSPHVLQLASAEEALA